MSCISCASPRLPWKTDEQYININIDKTKKKKRVNERLSTYIAVIYYTDGIITVIIEYLKKAENWYMVELSALFRSITRVSLTSLRNWYYVD